MVEILNLYNSKDALSISKKNLALEARFFIKRRVAYSSSLLLSDVLISSSKRVTKSWSILK